MNINKMQLVFLFLLALTITLKAQVPTGANLDFSSNNYTNWTAKEGSYQASTSSTPSWAWSTTYNDPTLATDGGGRLFEIYTDTAATDPRTSAHPIKKIPANWGYTHSSLINNANGGGNCSQLQYTMEVNSQNSLLTFNYAMVLEAPGHQGYENPTFQIDVMKHDPNNPSLMLNQLVDDCAFFEKQGATSAVDNITWFKDNSTYDPWVWCKWQQIKVNLAKFIGDRVTLRIRLGDCAFTAHGAYGYVVAKAEAPVVEVAGCAGEGDTVTLAHAPTGFESYKWFEIPELTSNQTDLEGYATTNATVGTDSVLVVTEAMMGNATQKFYAVELVSPRTQTTRPNCKAYISAKVNDARPRLDNFTYIPVNPEDPQNKVGFVFADVQASGNAYFLGWQKFDFGDGDNLIFTLNNNKWKIDSTTLTSRTIVKHSLIDPSIVDTVYHIYQNSGTYQVTRCAQTSVDAECDSCRKCKTIEVIVPERPTLSFIDRDTICFGFNDTITAISPNNVNTVNYKYEWWNENQAYTDPPMFVGKQYIAQNLTQTTIFKVRVTDTITNFYRKNNDTIYVQAFPDIKLTGDTIICLGNQASINANDATGETVAMQWSFIQPSTPAVITNPSTNPTLNYTPTKDTTIYLIAQTSQGCVAWKSVRLHIVDPRLKADKTKICDGESVVLTGSNAVSYSFTANPPDASLTENTKTTEPVTVSPLQTTTYTMKGYGSNDCFAERQITIIVEPHPVATISYSPSYVDVDVPILAIKDDSPNGVYSAWTFSDGGTSNARTINYTFHDLSKDSVQISLISSNSLGCSDTTQVRVPVELFAVWIPNAFTPNGDGSNDYFFFKTLNQLEDVNFEVFNRWGQQLYKYSEKVLNASDISDITKFGWDGKFKNEYVPSGTYQWKFTYKREGNPRVYKRTGVINVIR